MTNREQLEREIAEKRFSVLSPDGKEVYASDSPKDALLETHWLNRQHKLDGESDRMKRYRLQRNDLYLMEATND